jgi:membrane peptidoglycan carboxypeptidase
MEPQIARLISNVLSDNDARTFIFGAHNSLTLPDRPVAAKTGTTNNFHDAWTVGYTPSLVTAVWVGNNDNKEMKRGADSSAVAAPIWQAYMKRATKGMPIEHFTPPDPTTITKPAILGQVTEIKVKVDKISGKRATDTTPPDLIEERTYHDAHSILQYIDKDDPLGPAPSNPAGDPQYAAWEAAVQSWVQRNNWNTTSTPPTEYDDVHVAGNRPQVTIQTPSSGQTLFTRSFSITPSIQSTRPITRVEARLGQVLIGSSFTSPWSIEAHIPNSLESGPYDLVITAEADVAAD